jgi:hypothetical protein
MTLRGNEQIPAGDTLVVQRGNLKSEAYVVQVDQVFMPFRGYTTNVILARGTGFIGAKGLEFLSEVVGQFDHDG